MVVMFSTLGLETLYLNCKMKKIMKKERIFKWNWQKMCSYKYFLYLFMETGDRYFTRLGHGEPESTVIVSKLLE